MQVLELKGDIIELKHVGIEEGIGVVLQGTENEVFLKIGSDLERRLFVGLVELLFGDDVSVELVGFPLELGEGVFGLIVFVVHGVENEHFDVIFDTADHSQLVGGLGGGVGVVLSVHGFEPSHLLIAHGVHVVRNDLELVDEELVSVVRNRGELVLTGDGGLEVTFPSDGEIFVVDLFQRRFSVPVEVDVLVVVRLWRSDEVFVIVIVSDNSISVCFLLISEDSLAIFRSIICGDLSQFLEFDL